MKIVTFTTAYQIYLVPTLTITHSRYLNGSYAIGFKWLHKGIELTF